MTFTKKDNYFMGIVIALFRGKATTTKQSLIIRNRCTLNCHANPLETNPSSNDTSRFFFIAWPNSFTTQCLWQTKGRGENKERKESCTYDQICRWVTYTSTCSGSFWTGSAKNEAELRQIKWKQTESDKQRRDTPSFTMTEQHTMQPPVTVW